ncbi:PucR family transcriptional regulator [Cohnella lupini]|uniref:Purine catabolism regulator n=1 Tax=Cohnella lupini TaxID=1294267 RepID=A0A3D9I8J8_9BACL|nr:PucR family transcriptional regulator ligand-binding domain-containing protein [Cohnella lupini]RED58057.1 purine catabolism regulator [Cohnella lupini]
MTIDSELILTVSEALSRPLFRNAQLAAGDKGLGRQIRWVHILEVTHFEKLIHGQEMILTTGLGFNLDAVSSVHFMEKLISQNASCLCIEIGPYFERVSPELIELANAAGFPLILFPSTVRYVDITQDLHSLIINRHHKMLQELESISREFNRLTLQSQGTANVLKLLHRSSQNQILYLPLQGQPLFYPALPAVQQETLLRHLRERPPMDDSPNLKPGNAPELREYENQTLVLKPIGASEQTWAYLIMSCPRIPQEYEYLLMESASLSIAQELLRTRYFEERKLFSENLWVDELVSGRQSEEQQIKDLIGPDFKGMNELSFRVCLIEIGNLYNETPSENERESARLHLSLIVRSTFEKFGFRPLITLKNNRLAIIALDLKSKIPAKTRISQALESLRDMNGNSGTAGDNRLQDLQLITGVGKCYVQLKNAYASYQEALQALSLFSCYGKPVLFYEELGVFQLLLGLNDGTTLQTFIRHYLGPLIDHDKTKGSELLLTLKVYLDHEGSKQIAAQKLFIVRQSLYYRLEKMAELLGEDFLSAENRISIQVALRAYQLLYPDSFGDPQSLNRASQNIYSRERDLHPHSALLQSPDR